jgi:prepilin-type N-terminal cleavage/methylation domain-containing protein
MIFARVRRADEQTDGHDGGFTLVEMLVASVLLVLILVMTTTIVFSTSKMVNQTRTSIDLNEEARVALNRIAREFREASAITSVTNPSPSTASLASYSSYQPNGDVSITFNVDFNGDGTIEPNAADPETITYSYKQSTGQLLLQAGGQTLPVLAADVTGFNLTFTSRLTSADGSVDGLKDGVVGWEELDADTADGYGNANHQLDPLELGYVDSVGIQITVLKGSHKQTYQSQVNLRNRPY